MAYEQKIVASEPFDHGLEIIVEGSDPPSLGKGRISVSSEIEGVDGLSTRHPPGEMIPPVCVRSSTMKQDDRGVRTLGVIIHGIPSQTMKIDSVAGLESKRSRFLGHVGFRFDSCFCDHAVFAHFAI